MKLVIHAYEKTIPGYVRKYKVPEASDVAALDVRDQHGKIDIVLRRRSEFDANGFEKLELINLGHKMYDFCLSTIISIWKIWMALSAQTQGFEGKFKEIFADKVLFPSAVPTNM